MPRALRLKLDKGRFVGHTVPLKVLARLEGLEEALQATARAQFFSENPERRRAPKHFEDQFSLSLDSVTEGSAILEIVAPAEALMAFSSLALGLVALGERGEDGSLPRTAWRGLADLFRGFEPEETLELEGPQESVVVPPPLRDAVAAAAKRRPPPKAQALSIAGEVVGVRRPPGKGEADAWEVEVQFREGTQRRTLPVGDQDLDLCQGLLRDRTRLLRGVGSCHRGEEGELIEVLPGLRLSEIRGPALEARFAELASVEEGWWNGEGKAPSRSLLKTALRHAWMLVEQAGVDRPYVYPTPTGGIQLAWNTDPGSIEIDAEPDGKSGLLWSGLGNGDEELAATSDFATVIGWLRRARGNADA